MKNKKKAEETTFEPDREFKYLEKQINDLGNVFEEGNKVSPTREFVMKYGWVILVGLGTLTALSYFDVFNIPFTTGPTAAVVSPLSENIIGNYGLIIIIVIAVLGILIHMNFRKKHK